MSGPDHAAGHTALLIIDMISCWDFPDAEKLLPGALDIAPRIAALAARCRAGHVPVIYANDNRGQWRSDFAKVVQAALTADGDAAVITRLLTPDEEDYFVLKPKQSAFFGTPLELLLQHLKVRRVIVTGVSSDQCVLTTAVEARMRDLEVIVPQDCIASQGKDRNEVVLQQLTQSHRLSVTPGARIRLYQRRGAPQRHATTIDG
jgi:nicotinamidase-related amidase